jgi:AcrR family transcriptional regulator
MLKSAPAFIPAIPTTTNRADLRQRLIEAAKSAIRADGIAGLSNRKIAQACNTSTQSIYTFFGGQDGLVSAVFDYFVTSFSQAIADALEQGVAPPERLKMVGRKHREMARSDPALFLALTRSVAKEGKSQLALLRTSIAATRFIDTIIEGQEMGIFKRDGDPQALFEALCSAVHGLVVFELCGFFSSEAEAEKRLEDLMQVMMRGMLAT